MKKILSVLLCVALMFTFMTVISFAADGAAAADNGGETIWSIIVNLMQNAHWDQILKILLQTIQTFLRMIGKA